MSDATMDKAALEAQRPVGPDALDLGVDAAGELIGDIERVVGGPVYPIAFYQADVDEHLVRGAWPGASELEALRACGVVAVLDLCAERRQDAAVTAAGMIPANIPLIDNTAPAEGALEAFLATVDTLKRVFVHCEAGKGRTGCMVAGYRVRRCGWTPEAALEEAERYGLAVPCQKAWILALEPTDRCPSCERVQELVRARHGLICNGCPHAEARP